MKCKAGRIMSSANVSRCLGFIFFFTADLTTVYNFFQVYYKT